MDYSVYASPDPNQLTAFKFRRRAVILSLSSLAVILTYLLSTYLIFLQTIVVVVNNPGSRLQYTTDYAALHPLLVIATTFSLLFAYAIMISLAFRYNRKAIELYSNKKANDLSPNERRSIMKEINAKRKRIQ